jgi:hypothetical protein
MSGMVGIEKSGLWELVEGLRVEKISYVVEVEGIYQVRHVCSSPIRDLLCPPS